MSWNSQAGAGRTLWGPKVLGMECFEGEGLFLWDAQPRQYSTKHPTTALPFQKFPVKKHNTELDLG